jgi:hypothetical protein
MPWFRLVCSGRSSRSGLCSGACRDRSTRGDLAARDLSWAGRAHRCRRARASARCHCRDSAAGVRVCHMRGQATAGREVGLAIVTPAGSRCASGARGRTSSTSSGGRRCFLGLDGTTEPIPVGLPADAVGLSVFDRRRVTLDADPELEAQVERFLIAEPELSAELVDANLLGQLALWSSLPGRARRRYWPPARLHILPHRRRYREPEREIRTQVVSAPVPQSGRDRGPWLRRRGAGGPRPDGPPGSCPSSGGGLAATGRFCPGQLRSQVLHSHDGHRPP